MSIIAPQVYNDDALVNQFQVIIPPFPGVVRPDMTVFKIQKLSIPDKEISTYDTDYKVYKFPKPKGKIGTANTFNITFRIDKYWTIYQGFRNWNDIIINPVTGVASPDFIEGVSPIRVPITILTVDTNDIPTSVGWAFEGCIPTKVGGTTLQHADGGPVEVDVTFSYIKMI